MFGGGLFGANHFGGLSGNGLFGDMMGFHSMFADPFFSDMGSGMQFLTSPAFQADPNSTCSRLFVVCWNIFLFIQLLFNLHITIKPKW